MRTRILATFVILFAVAGCVKYTIVPPAIDLAAAGTIGLVTFKAENAKGDLDAVATQYFLQEVTAAQRVPVVELGPHAAVLADLGKTSFDREAVLAIGQKQGVEAVFIGEIKVTKVKPQIDLAAPLSKTLFARAAFDISVAVRLVSTANGATLWTESAARQGTVGSVGMDNGVPVFAVRDQSAAMAELLREVMFRLTWDFRPTRQRL
ncbi:MAG: hypothetical protein A2W03_02275 [Candidatus Aminicenantes bacterium RBG_16_63_16]|nr:MAG: hypothetical protein A2W03_02275 [Candidatus Aminicenantes bacterium RBG_16_63_16]